MNSLVRMWRCLIGVHPDDGLARKHRDSDYWLMASGPDPSPEWIADFDSEDRERRRRAVAAIDSGTITTYTGDAA